MRNIKLHILLSALMLTLISCSDYSRIVKDDNYKEKLAKAEDLFRDNSFNRALVLYEQVYQRHPSDEMGEKSYFKLGMTYFKQEDYYMAAYYFGNFPRRFPRSNNVQDAMYYSALSTFKTSPSHTLDQEDTELALNELQAYVSQFPNSRRVDTCNLLMDELRKKLEDKAWDGVKMYDRMSKYNAAVFSAKAFLEDFPTTDRRLEAAFLMMENAFVLAEKSVFSKRKDRYQKVIDMYDIYQDDFQVSRYVGDAFTLYEKAQKGLEEVDEQVTFEEIENLYNKAQRSSTAKKSEYLEETLRLYYNFAQRYPNSEYMSRAEEIFRRAEREKQSTYSY